MPPALIESVRDELGRLLLFLLALARLLCVLDANLSLSEHGLMVFTASLWSSSSLSAKSMYLRS